MLTGIETAVDAEIEEATRLALESPYAEDEALLGAYAMPVAAPAVRTAVFAVASPPEPFDSVQSRVFDTPVGPPVAGSPVEAALAMAGGD